jgi:hypothetical protein
MDPIEKLLNDLAPARATDKLDQAMVRLFDRADRRARMRRGFRGGVTLAAVLAIGLGVGYRAGTHRQSPASPPPAITYAVPISSEFIRALEPYDTLETAPARTGSIIVSVVKNGTV